jgi:CDP-diacylglycerol--serine O-phosphatidyltransferase
MQPRFVGRLSVADAVTVGNAAIGFLAAVATTGVGGVGLAARLILLAAIADALDGILARRYGGSAAGEYLDSLADVASFGVAPALIVASVARETWSLDGAPVAFGLGIALPVAFVAMAVTRLGLYTPSVESDSTS